MTLSTQPGTGYGRATRSTGTPRDVEYQLFSQVTGRLNRALAAGTGFTELAAALNDNLQLWQTIALDVADDANALPPKLRARLFYIFEFTAAHSRKVLRREAGAEVLVEINTAVMRGLRAHPAEPTAEGAASCLD